MRTLHRTAVLAATLATAAGALVGGAATASADDAPFEISQQCSKNDLHFTHTITVEANNHWKQRIRVHNSNGRRYKAEIRTTLAGYNPSAVIKPADGTPGYQGPTAGILFDSDEKEIGVAGNNDTKVWYKEGEAPAQFYAWLKLGGSMTSLCSAEKSHAFPADKASVNTVISYWQAQA
jgi:hypothetical protein